MFQSSSHSQGRTVPLTTEGSMKNSGEGATQNDLQRDMASLQQYISILIQKKYELCTDMPLSFPCQVTGLSMKWNISEFN